MSAMPRPADHRPCPATVEASWRPEGSRGPRVATVTRERRARIQAEAASIRRRCQRQRHTIERTVLAIRTALPEVTALEAWRLALGWSRREAIGAVAAQYEAEGLRPPGLSESMLCRWEHHGPELPGAEYRVMLCRAYGARP